MGMLWFGEPSTDWDKALPIGNGRLGAMVYGGIEKETLCLNQDSVWYGGFIDRINPDAYSNLEKVRGLIREGKIPEAEKLLKYAFSGTPQSERPYQPLAFAEITYHGMDGEAMDYRRELCLCDGIVTEEFELPHQKIRKEYLASYPHGVIAIHLWAEEGTISMDILLQRKRFYDHAGKLDDHTIYIDGTLGERGVSFIAALRAQTDSGAVRTIGEHLLVENAKELTLYIGGETSFYEKDWVAAAKEKLDRACEDGFEAVKKQHIEDYREIYERVVFDMGEAGADIPIDRRMEIGKEKGFDGAFGALYFQYGRYLLISSSRPGSLPANLQGIWNEEMLPSWDSKFTININTEMNYWPAESCSLAECHMPLFDHLLRMWENGKKTAGRMYGCRGFVAHHNTDLWGDCAPQDIYIPATYWVMGGAWLCTHIWTHYLYTQDTDFLQKMYPVLKDAVLFFHDYLIEVDGKFFTSPSVSPENTYIMPDGVQGHICMGASMDIQILNDLIKGYLEASAVLKIQDEIVDRSKEILRKLPEIKIGKHGQIMEWQEDYEEAEPGHRHISQLYALYPSNQISVDKTPVLAEAAKATLKRRLYYGGGHTGWSCAWIVGLYARLWESEKAVSMLDKLWSQSTFPNLMDTHPRRGGYVFQIDGNLGATAAITEMLVQSSEERTYLLPALPDRWKKGKIAGLTLCGGARLGMEWENGKLTGCRIWSKRPMELTVIYGEEERVVSLQAGKTTELKFL